MNGITEKEKSVSFIRDLEEMNDDVLCGICETHLIRKGTWDWEESEIQSGSVYYVMKNGREYKREEERRSSSMAVGADEIISKITWA